MSDDDFRDLLYVVRAIRRTYESNYGAFRHSAEKHNADVVFNRLFARYFPGQDPHGYPDYEPAMENSDEPVADVIRKFNEAGAEGHAKIQAFMRRP